MIKKISLKQLVATELYQFFSLVLGIVDVANPTVSKIKTQRDVLNDLIHKLQAAINKEKGFALTKVIEALDTRRDNAISGLMMWIAGLTKHPNSVTKEAAKIVKAYLDTHVNAIASQNYQTESAILSKIVADYKSNAAWKIALDGLGGKDWMDEIEAANTAFITTYQQRTSDMGVATNAELFHTLRTPAVTAYLALIDIVETRYKTAIADGADTTVLKKCIYDINATITQYQQLIEATKAAKKGGDKK